jgi:hypothetical protein
VQTIDTSSYRSRRANVVFRSLAIRQATRNDQTPGAYLCAAVRVIAVGANVLSEMDRYIDCLFCTLHSRLREPGDFATRHATRRNFAKDKAEAKASFLRISLRSRNLLSGLFDRHPARFSINVKPTRTQSIRSIRSTKRYRSLGLTSRATCFRGTAETARQPQFLVLFRENSQALSSRSTDRRRDIRKSTVRNRVCQPHPNRARSRTGREERARG